jgi:hypothetical protein
LPCIIAASEAKKASPSASSNNCSAVFLASFGFEKPVFPNFGFSNSQSGISPSYCSKRIEISEKSRAIGPYRPSAASGIFPPFGKFSMY